MPTLLSDGLMGLRMIKKPTQEKIREFWERYIPERAEAGRIVQGLPNISLDLNNLFKYAVPKVYDMRLLRLNRFEGEWQTAYLAQVRLARQPWLLEVRDKDPALALFWAIYEAVKKK